MLKIWLFMLLVFGVIFGTATAHADIPAPVKPTQTIPPAFTLGQKEVEQAVARELMDKGAGTEIKANIFGGKTGVYYEGTQTVSPDIAGLTFDKAAGRFSANLVVMAGNQAVSAVPISGKYQEMVKVPVLKHQMRSGEPITDDDIDFADFPALRTRSDIATDASQLVGQMPRGVISANRPVRVGELSAMAAIKKNALVSMRYKSDSMEITTSGQAMQNGATGDVIQVKNLLSKQLVRAVVIDSASVSVNALTATAQLTGGTDAKTN